MPVKALALTIASDGNKRLSLMLKKFKQLYVCVPLLIGTAGVTWNAGAASPVQEGAKEAITIEADRAAAIARENTGGRVLDVRLLADDGGPAYAVRLLLNPGRVRTVLVDGNSGQLH